MEHQFWHERWQANRIGFHQDRVNPMLERHLGALGLAPGARIFVPLCGKTVDVGWLMAKGLRVVGAELSEIAIRQLFEGLEIDPQVTAEGKLTRFSAPGIEMFVGDIFDLDAARLGPVDAVYDRAALIALPPGLRRHYADHMPDLTGRAPSLLVTLDYDQSLMAGPPFSVDADEVAALYRERYDITELQRAEVPGGVKGIAPGSSIAWHLTARV